MIVTDTGVNAYSTPALPLSGEAFMPAVQQAMSEIELQGELHGTWVGLNVRDTAEAAAGLMHSVGFPVRARRQAKAGVRQSQILMVERVEHFPAELEETLLVEMEFFHKRRIQVPKAGCAQARQISARRSKLPPAIISGVGIGLVALIAAINRLKRGSADPIGFLRYFRATFTKGGIPYQIGEAGEPVAGSGDVQRHA